MCGGRPSVSGGGLRPVSDCPLKSGPVAGCTGADWGAWLPAFARLAGWSGVRWAATSNAVVGHTTYPVNRGRVGIEGREGSKGKVTNRS